MPYPCEALPTIFETRGDDNAMWRHYITKQRGAELYHLRNNLVSIYRINFENFFLQHLRWCRVTWLVCTYLWPPLLKYQHELESLTRTLPEILLPESCQEVALELETREDLLDRLAMLKDQAKVCRQPRLTRSDGAELGFDESLALQYTWTGSGQARWGPSAELPGKASMAYHTVRLCWRTNVARREYMSYDRLDCLNQSGFPEIKSVAPLD
jgi:hypothetical protein